MSVCWESMIFRAIEFTAKAHNGQYRRGTKIPYIIHPLGVAKILIENSCSDEIVVAGILHDTVEDTSISLEDIRKIFGEKVANLVEGSSAPDMSDTWESRKQHTIDLIKTAPMDLLMVECADKLDNIKSIREDYRKHGEAIWQRFNRPKDKQKWYYQSLAKAFLSRAEDEPGISLFKEFTSEVQKVFG